MSNAKYHSHIDGLRAIAVLAVLINHLHAAALPGGFVGVDIFFVISGYLITSQVHKEICDGRFSIKEFYKRRINRIAPALMAMLLVTYAVGAVVLSPADLIRMGNASVSAALGVSNIFLWREYGNYFAATAGEAPLLHTWSLGVEEQFYLVWPLIVLLLARLRWRLALALLVTLALGALLVSEVGTKMMASAAYYLLPARFFELMLGGLLAFATFKSAAVPRGLACAGLVLGFTLLGGSLFWIDKSSSFPGVTAIWPCLGAALLILTGSVSHPLSRVLTNRPMVFVGLISYSVYLWHWPIIAYLNYVAIDTGVFSKTVVAICSIVLGWLSWKYIETPLRRSGALMPFGRVFGRRFAAPLVTLAAVAVATVHTSGFPQRFDPRVAELEASLEAKPNLLREGCHVPTALYRTEPSEKCRLGVSKGRFDGILIGDSFANHFTGMIDIMAEAEGISVMDYTMDGCPPILGYDTGKSGVYSINCIKRNQAAYAVIAKDHYDHVILAGNWPRNTQAGTQLMASIESIITTGSKLTLILNNEHIKNASSCPIRQLMYGTTESCTVDRQEVPDYFSEIKARYPQVHIIDPNQVICSGRTCSPIVDGTLLYRDDAHLNDIGSRLIGESMVRDGASL